MARSPGIRAARVAGLLIGASAALVLVLVNRPAANSADVGAKVSAHVNPTGELAVRPAHPKPFLDEPELKPGQSASGTFQLRNQTGEALDVHLSALSSHPALDGVLEVELRSGGRVIATGSLGSLQKSSVTALPIGPSAAAEVTLTATLAPGSGGVAAAALVDIGVVFKPEPGGG